MVSRLPPALAVVALAVAVPARAASLPDPRLTPGDALPGVGASDVCRSGWAKAHRDVPNDVRAAVFAAHGLPSGNWSGYCDTPHGCELDHLIPLELGGSNDPRNLWPQPYDGAMSARAKDKLENRLHALVCAGAIPLDEAQRAIARDWLAAHRKYLEGRGN